MEYVISIEEVEALETIDLSDLEIELYYHVYTEKQKVRSTTFEA